MQSARCASCRVKTWRHLLKVPEDFSCSEREIQLGSLLRNIALTYLYGSAIVSKNSTQASAKQSVNWSVYANLLQNLFERYQCNELRRFGWHLYGILHFMKKDSNILKNVKNRNVMHIPN